jgi:hypothetical protein
MSNVRKQNSCTIVPSSQTFRSYKQLFIPVNIYSSQVEESMNSTSMLSSWYTPPCLEAQCSSEYLRLIPAHRSFKEQIPGWNSNRKVWMNSLLSQKVGSLKRLTWWVKWAQGSTDLRSVHEDSWQSFAFIITQTVSEHLARNLAVKAELELPLWSSGLRGFPSSQQ